MSPILTGVIASGVSGNLANPAWDFIAGVSNLGGVSTYTFNSIPQTYKHLQIRAMTKCNRSNVNAPLWVNVNGDETNANYTTIYFYTFGTSANIDQAWSTGEGGFSVSGAGNTVGSNVFGGGYMNIYNYTETNKFKNGLGISSINNFSSGDQVLGPIFSVWKNTNAITSVTVRAFEGTFVGGSAVSIYGLKG
jgi:hypothetical protein